MSQTFSGANLSLVPPTTQWVDPASGLPTQAFFQFINALWRRTGGQVYQTSGESLTLAQAVAELEALAGTPSYGTTVELTQLLMSEVQSTGRKNAADPTACVVGTGQKIFSTLSAWEMTGWVPGKVNAPIGGLWAYSPTDNTILPQTLPDSTATCTAAPTAAVSMNLTIGGTTVGTLSFAAAATTGVWTLSAQKMVAKGTVLALSSPAAADTTFSGLSFSLKGFR